MVDRRRWDADLQRHVGNAESPAESRGWFEHVLWKALELSPQRGAAVPKQRKFQVLARTLRQQDQSQTFVLVPLVLW